MLKTSIKADNEKLLLEKELSVLDLPKILEDKAIASGEKLESKLSEIYATAPPRGNSKYIWSLDPEKDKAARGWWFWKVRKGEIPTDGKHYKRSGKPPYGVGVFLDSARRAILFQVVMRNPKMIYPFGALNGVDTRNPSHKVTGWVFASPLVNQALQDTQSELLGAMANHIKEI